MKSNLLLIILALPLLGLQAFLYAAMGKSGFMDHLPLVLAVNILLGAIVLLTRPHVAFMIVAAYLPFARIGVEHEFGPITLNPYSAGMIIMFGGSLIYKVLRSKSLHLNLTDLFLVFACGVFLYTTITSPAIMEAGFLSFNSIFIPVCAYGAARVFIDSDERYDATMRILLVALAVFAALSLMTFVSTGTRARFVGSPPVGTATLLIIALPYLWATRLFPAWLRKALFGLCLVAFVLTFTRVYLLVALLAPLFSKIIKRGRSFGLYLNFFIATLILTFAVIGAANMFKPNVSNVDPETRKTSERMTSEEYWLLSIYGRIEQYEMGIENYMRKPFFGTGLYRGPVNITQHNFHIEWLEYGGTVGYLCFICFFLSHAWRMADLARKDVPIRLNLLITFLVMANCYTNGLLHGYMPNVVLFIMGLSEARAGYLSERAPEPDPEPEPEPKHKPLRNGHGRRFA